MFGKRARAERRSTRGRLMEGHLQEYLNLDGWGVMNQRILGANNRIAGDRHGVG